MLNAEALALLQQTAVNATAKVVEIDGIQYSAAPLKDPRQKEPEPAPLGVGTLTSLVDYLLANRDALVAKETLVHIDGPGQVSVLSRLQGRFQQRFRYLTATAPSRMGSFRFGEFCELESLLIALQSVFDRSGDRAAVLQLLGTVRDEAIKTNQDDGVSQTVTAKAGLAVVSSVPVPNPVALSPFRTFLEIEQPVSPFVFRMRKKDGVGITAALFEADGGAWQSAAIASIRAFLVSKLPPDFAILG